MIGPASVKRGGKGQSSGDVGRAFAGLFPASDSDDEQDYGGHRAAVPPPVKVRGAAQQDWPLFPDKDEDLAQPALASATGGRRSKNRAASRVGELVTGSPAASEKVVGGNGEQNPGKKKKTKKTKKRSNAVVKEEQRVATPSIPHASVENDDEIDLEADRGTRLPSRSRSAEERRRAIDEFEVSKTHEPKRRLALTELHT